MKRKVIIQANQAHTVTLPIEWVRINRISKDSEVDLTIQGKSIIINSNNPLRGKSICIDANTFDDRMLYFHIVAAYAQGVDEIEILSDKDISSGITSSLNNLIGYALISQEKNKSVIRDIHPGSYSDLDEIFKRVFQMIILFYEAAINDIFGDERETSQSLKARDAEVNKFCVFLQRAINKSSYEDQIRARIIFTYSFALEKISDEIERLWRTNIKYKIKKTQDIRKCLEMSKEGIGKAFDLYFSFNKKNIADIRSLREAVREKYNTIKKIDTHTTRFLHHVLKISEDVADLNHLALMKHP